jgi:hypothetical protein
MNALKIAALALTLSSVLACGQSSDRPANDPSTENLSNAPSDTENPTANPGTGTTGSSGADTSTTSGPGATTSGAGAGTPSTGSAH